MDIFSGTLHSLLDQIYTAPAAQPNDDSSDKPATPQHNTSLLANISTPLTERLATWASHLREEGAHTFLREHRTEIISSLFVLGVSVTFIDTVISFFYYLVWCLFMLVLLLIIADLALSYSGGPAAPAS